MNQKCEWKVGNRYQVVEDGRRITGKIIKIDKQGYHVEWSNGEITIEDSISPASFDALRLYPKHN